MSQVHCQFLYTFNFFKITSLWKLLSFHIYRWWYWGSENFSNSSRVPQLIMRKSIIKVESLSFHRGIKTRSTFKNICRFQTMKRRLQFKFSHFISETQSSLWKQFWIFKRAKWALLNLWRVKQDPQIKFCSKDARQTYCIFGALNGSGDGISEPE